ncbi:unnamed protein product, partial [Linum tenue]
VRSICVSKTHNRNSIRNIIPYDPDILPISSNPEINDVSSSRIEHNNLSSETRSPDLLLLPPPHKHTLPSLPHPQTTIRHVVILV